MVMLGVPTKGSRTAGNKDPLTVAISGWHRSSDAKSHGWFLYLALGPQLIGHTSYNWALRYLSATYVTVALLSEPISSSLLAWLLLQAPPTLLEVLGGTLILLGIAIASRAERT